LSPFSDRPDATNHRIVVRVYGFPVARVTLVKGDITSQQVDAIVNAANGSLMGGGGVDGAIHRAGGPEILNACKELRADTYPDGLPTGAAVATTAGRLPAKWVIHTVGPVYSKSEDRSGLLASCHTEALKIADKVGATTVSFPAISTGVYGYPLEEAAPVAVQAVANADTNVREVSFVLFDDRSYSAFESTLRDLEAQSGG
jgi:O-acetyl-ADP-ribose deacetylase (regulator of RNase III)